MSGCLFYLSSSIACLLNYNSHMWNHVLISLRMWGLVKSVYACFCLRNVFQSERRSRCPSSHSSSSLFLLLPLNFETLTLQITCTWWIKNLRCRRDLSLSLSFSRPFHQLRSQSRRREWWAFVLLLFHFCCYTSVVFLGLLSPGRRDWISVTKKGDSVDVFPCYTTILIYILLPLVLSSSPSIHSLSHSSSSIECDYLCEKL